MKNIIIKWEGSHWHAYKSYFFGLIKWRIRGVYSINSREDCVLEVKKYIEKKSVSEKVEL